MTSTPPSNPFPGLRPFRESESHLFFGRSAHVDELLTELTRSRFVAVMGASGSGKSSLVAAGLLPALHGGFSPRVGSRWRVATFRPGASPIHNLACALAVPEVLGADDADPLIAVAQVEATLRRSGLGLADAARRSRPLEDGRLLVVVDQFEELFRFHAAALDPGVHDDAGPFVQLLLEATRSDAPVDVVLTMRSDFLGDCSQFREPPGGHQPGDLPGSPADALPAARGHHRAGRGRGRHPEPATRATGPERRRRRSRHVARGAARHDADLGHLGPGRRSRQPDRRRALRGLWRTGGGAVAPCRRGLLRAGGRSTPLHRRADVQAHHGDGRRPPRGPPPHVAARDRRRHQRRAGRGSRSASATSRDREGRSSPSPPTAWWTSRTRA